MSSENNKTPEMMMQEVYDLLAKYGVSVTEGEFDAAKIRLEDLGVENVEDLAALTVDELKSLGMKAAKARRMLDEAKKLCGADGGGELAATAPLAPPVNPLFPQGVPMPVADATAKLMLPELPDEKSWFEMLCCNDQLTMKRGAALSAALALVFGGFDIRSLPKKVMALMAEQDYAHYRPASDTYWKVRNLTKKKEHGEILAAMAGGSTTSITVAERNAVIGRLEKYTRPRLLACFDAAIKINEELQSIKSLMGYVPDLELLYSSAEEFRRSLNMSLASTGAVAATDIAMDYSDFGKIFEFEDLYLCCGVADRDELLMKIDMGVTSLAVRQEKYIRQFVLAMIDLQMVQLEQRRLFCQQLGDLVSKIDRRLLTGEDVTMSAPPSGEVVEAQFTVVDDGDAPAPQLGAGGNNVLPGNHLKSVTGKSLNV